MALFHVGYTIRDDDGDTSTLSIKVPRAALTLAQIEEFAEEMAVLVNEIIDGVIDEIRVIASLALPGGLRTDPVAYCEVQKGALFAFSANGTEYRHSVRVPALKPSLFAGNDVTVAQSDVAAFIAGMEDGLDATGTQVEPSNKAEADLESLISAKKSFRRK